MCLLQHRSENNLDSKRERILLADSGVSQKRKQKAEPSLGRVRTLSSHTAHGGPLQPRDTGEESKDTHLGWAPRLTPSSQAANLRSEEILCCSSCKNSHGRGQDPDPAHPERPPDRDRTCDSKPAASIAEP